jgi:hypothetical protein
MRRREFIAGLGAPALIRDTADHTGAGVWYNVDAPAPE